LSQSQNAPGATGNGAGTIPPPTGHGNAFTWDPLSDESLAFGWVLSFFGFLFFIGGFFCSLLESIASVTNNIFAAGIVIMLANQLPVLRGWLVVKDTWWSRRLLWFFRALPKGARL
jgi:hypothetical protein